MIGDAVEWADKITTEAADVERVKAVLEFIEKEQGTLQQFTGDLLTKAVTSLS